jgi:hypothetical protein
MTRRSRRAAAPLAASAVSLSGAAAAQATPVGSGGPGLAGR